MKKVLVTMAVLCMVASMSQASIMNVKLTTQVLTEPFDINGDGSVMLNDCVVVYVYGKVTVDTAVPGETIVNRGIADFAITVYTSGVGNTGLLQPFAESPSAPQTGLVIYNQAAPLANAWGQTPPPSRSNYLAESGGADTDLDNVQMAGALKSSKLTVGATGTFVLLATQYWQATGAGGQVTLKAFTENSSRHWNMGLPDPFKEAFTGYAYTNATVEVPAATPTTILPTIALSVTNDHQNLLGVQYTDYAVSADETLYINGHNNVTFSTAGTTGDAVDTWSFTNGATVLSGTGSWSGDSYDLYGGTLTYSATNAGGTSSISFNVIPEPATLALLGFGAVATLLRRKK